MQYMGEEEIAVDINNVFKIRESYKVYIKWIYTGITVLFAK